MRIICFLVGFGFSVIGFIYIIAYLNYLTIGFSFNNYLYFIGTKLECLLAPIGLIIIAISIFMKGNIHVLCL